MLYNTDTEACSPYRDSRGIILNKGDRRFTLKCKKMGKKMNDLNITNTKNIGKYCYNKYNKEHSKKPHRVWTAVILAVALLLAVTPAALAVTGEDIVNTAEAYLGYPYAYQAAGPDAFDCGGFVWYVFNQAGVEFPLRISSSALAADNIIIYNENELELGDILFFGYVPSSISHWGIYAGGGNIIHAYNEGTGVVVTPLSEVRPYFCYACRIASLLGCNSDYSPGLDTLDLDTAEISLPWQVQEAIDAQLIPLAFRCDYEEIITADEMAELLFNLSELITGEHVEDLLAEGGLLAEDLPGLWADDALALASRALAVMQTMPEDTLQKDAVSILLVSLYEKTGQAVFVPDIEPEVPYTTITVPDPDEQVSARICEEKTLTAIQDPAVICGEETRYIRKQAFLTIFRIYELLSALPE
jgi:hypothetical protein